MLSPNPLTLSRLVGEMRLPASLVSFIASRSIRLNGLITVKYSFSVSLVLLEFPPGATAHTGPIVILVSEKRWDGPSCRAKVMLAHIKAWIDSNDDFGTVLLCRFAAIDVAPNKSLS